MENSLPIHHCQSAYCTNQAGYWHGRIVCLGDPGDSVIGWCNACEKYVCGQCALQAELSESEWNNLSDHEIEWAAYYSYNVTPAILQCKRCGTTLQKGKFQKILLLNGLTP